MQVIAIVTQLYPAIDGVGDYALNLARQLRHDHAIDTHFIVGNPAWDGDQVVDGFSVSRVSERSTSALLTLLEPHNAENSSILLHYVPHGYAKKACPFWLIQALEHWKQRSSQAQLVTMFHELYALGAVWTSDFWLSPVQKQLAIRLARLSDRALTNCQIYADRLQRFRSPQTSAIPILPVPSNIGEPRDLLPLSQRDRRLVIFGQGGSKRRVYQSLALIHQACQQLEIQEIWDIGPDPNLSFASIDGIPLKLLGQQSRDQISEILRQSIAGFVSYPPLYLSKSGVFAAYCSHGMLPINNEGSPQLNNGVASGQHYWLPDSPLNEENQERVFQAIANNANAWYQSHTRSLQAKIIAPLLLSTCAAQPTKRV